MRHGRQTTLRDTAAFVGTGVHSGSAARLWIHPAEPGTGLVFSRNCNSSGAPREREVRACHRAVTATALATVLGDAEGPVVSTVEHVMAALFGLGVDNAVIEVDGPEVPILDGSSQPFVTGIDQVGLVQQTAVRRCIKVLRPVRVSQGTSFAELVPFAGGFRAEVEIDFEHRLVGRQSYAATIDPTVFRRDLARARTFGFMRDVSKLWNAGYALGASLDNTLVVGDDRIVNPEGLRFADEFVRHKTLDAIGDLALAGAPILGLFRSFCGGHRLNHAVVRALHEQPDAFAMVDMPARRERGHAEVVSAHAAAAFRPDVS
jgi:UDP-3-O-[3-hydroxymyristoyl] N-acetylglucosamine deacetylase